MLHIFRLKNKIKEDFNFHEGVLASRGVSKLLGKNYLLHTNQLVEDREWEKWTP